MDTFITSGSLIVHPDSKDNPIINKIEKAFKYDLFIVNSD